MAVVGGSVEEVSIKGRLFAVAADADVERQLGGHQVEVQANGNGSARIIKTRVPWVLSGLTLQINDDNDDQKFLQDIADGNEFVPITITFASGATFMGRGTIADEITYSTESATAEVTLTGEKNLEQQ